MNTGIGQTGVLNTIDRLLPNDRTTDLGSIDPSIIIPTFPLEPGWFDMDWRPYASNTTSIAAGIAEFLDTDLTNWFNGGSPPVAPPTQMFDVQQNRILSWRVSTGGTGTVSPVRVTVSWVSPGVAGWDIVSILVANPGTLTAGPFFFPAGFQGRVRVAQGGAGDTCEAHLTGQQAPLGVPLPSLSPVVFNDP